MSRTSPFRPAWWLPGPHLQTLWPRFHRRALAPYVARERLELPDGDFIDLDWTDGDGRPRVLLLHGLEGSSSSPYALGIGHARDDPFVPPDALPADSELSERVRLERSAHGGHVGFIAGPVPGQPIYWLERRLAGFFRRRLAGGHCGRATLMRAPRAA